MTVPDLISLTDTPEPVGAAPPRPLPVSSNPETLNSPDRFARLAALLCDASAALILQGNTAPFLPLTQPDTETARFPIDHPWFALTLQTEDLLLISDNEPRVASMPLATPSNAFPLFAGIPLRESPQGEALGLLCVLDTRARLLTEAQCEGLRLIGRQIAEWMAARARADALREPTSEERRVRERYERAFEATQDGLWDWNLRTNEVYFSPRWKEMLGYAADELPDALQTWAELLHPEDREPTMQAVTDYLEGSATRYAVQFRMQHKDGSYRWILARGVAQRDAEGRAHRLTGTHYDITERKRAEEMLQEQEEHLRRLIDSATDYAIMTLDVEGNILSWSAGAERILGYPSDEILGRHYSCLFLPAQIEEGRLERELQEAREKGRYCYQGWRRCKDGSLRYMDAVVTPQYNAAGTLVGFSKFSRDVTERRQTDDLLPNLVAIFEATSDFIGACTPDGSILYANQAFCDLAGLEKSASLAQNSFFSFYTEESLMLLIQEGLPTVRREGIWRGETTLRAADGRLVPTSQVIIAHANDEGDVDFFSTISHDISTIRQAEEKVRQSERQYRSLIDAFAQVVWKANAEGKVFYAQDNTGTFPGESASSENGWIDFVHPDDQEQAFAVWEAACQEKKQYENEFRLVYPDGRFVYVVARAVPMLNADGEVLEWIGTLTDVTQKKQAEVILQEYKQHLEEQIETQTEELHQAVAILQNEVIERTRAEQQIVKLNQRLEARLERITSLRQIDMAINSSLDLRLTLSIFLDQVLTQMRVDAATILICDPVTRILEFAGGKGFRTDALRHTRLQMGSGHAGQAALERRVIFISDLSRAPGDFGRSPRIAQEEFCAYLAVPLLAKGTVRGVLELFHRSPMQPDEEWLEFVETLGGQAAIAIESAMLFENLQRMNSELVVAYDATIEGWSRALELRDRETEGHTQRVTQMSVTLARAMGISGADLVNLRRGALLHDIGKMGIPDHILHKPGKLNDEEREVMQRHTTYAYEMLWPIKFLRPAIDIPYGHHEKWDGTGYPRGLKGENIPLSARLFAVVDVWDALASERPYKKAWSKQQIMEHLRAESGTHFDPMVVETFLHILATESFGTELD